MTYLEQMKSDILDYIKSERLEIDGRERDEVCEELHEILWTVDSVTGNGSGSYTFNSAKAREYVLDDGEEHIKQLMFEYGMDANTVVEHLFDWEFWDVSIRCYLLYQAIDLALNEFNLR